MEADLGIAYRGATAWTTIEISNPTDSEVAVLEVDSSCGCLVTDFHPTRLQPGAVRAFQVRVATGEKARTAVERVRFFSTDSQLNAAHVDVNVTVIRGPAFQASLGVGTVRSEDGALLELRYDFTRCDLSGLNRERPVAKIELTQTEKVVHQILFLHEEVRWEDDVLIVPMEIMPSASRGFLDGNLRVHFDPGAGAGIAEGFFFEHQVDGTFLPYLYSQPSVLSQSLLRKLGGIDVDLCNDLGEEIQFPSAKGRTGAIGWTVVPSADGSAENVLATVSLRVDPGVDASSLGEVVNIPFELDGDNYTLGIFLAE